MSQPYCFRARFHCTCGVFSFVEPKGWSPIRLEQVRAAMSISTSYWGILVYNICLISISNSVSDGATNKSVLNIKRA